jgi:glyoxylase-like metal-dependent hydrolase (beta-lactamase superfamily II)
MFPRNEKLGSIALYFPREQAVFTGDTLFKDAVGRTDLSYSDKTELIHSLQKLMKLPEETIVYPGHGELTTIGEEHRGH